jgi:tetratricopeptide (TPR) repeat protein
VPEPGHYYANLQRGSLLLNQKRPLDALPFLQAAIAADPEAAQGYAELARCYIAIPAEKYKSIGAIDRAIGLEPGNSVYRGLKSWYLLCLLNFHGALRVAKEGLALNPTCAQSLNSLANAYTKLSRWRDVEAACRRILEQDPNDGPGLNLLAQALRHLRRWKETREVVARLLARMPNNAFGHANAGYAALEAGDHLRANYHFRESLRLDPHFDLARRGLVQSLRARVWFLRFNQRLTSFLRQPLTVKNVLIKTLVVFGVITLLGGSIAVADAYNNSLVGFVASVLPLVACGYVVLVLIHALLGEFLLMFDPLGRHAMTQQEKTKASMPAVAFGVIECLFVTNDLWPVALVLAGIVALLALIIQLPLLRDRWLRRKVEQEL